MTCFLLLFFFIDCIDATEHSKHVAQHKEPNYSAIANQSDKHASDGRKYTNDDFSPLFVIEEGSDSYDYDQNHDNHDQPKVVDNEITVKELKEYEKLKSRHISLDKAESMNTDRQRIQRSVVDNEITVEELKQYELQLQKHQEAELQSSDDSHVDVGDKRSRFRRNATWNKDTYPYAKGPNEDNNDSEYPIFIFFTFACYLSHI